MSHKRKFLMSQLPHDRNLFNGHLPLGVGVPSDMMTGLMGFSPASNVGQNHAEPVRQSGCQTVPAKMSLGVPVQHQNRRPIAGGESEH